MIMNQMLHDLFPSITTIGEDVSGMPTFSRCGSLSAPGLLLYHLMLKSGWYSTLG